MYSKDRLLQRWILAHPIGVDRSALPFSLLKKKYLQSSKWGSRALHAQVGDVRAVPQIHGKRRCRSESFASGEGVRARNPSAGGDVAEKVRLRLGVLKTGGKAFIGEGGTGDEPST
jgi:hypothetical protein